MKTAKGIYLDLKETEYSITLSGITFYFSSKLYLKKFMDNVNNYVNQENIKLCVKYNVNIDLTLFLMISLYRKIEKRGFRIYDKINNKEITENVSFINTMM